MDGRPWPTVVDAHVHAAIPGIIERTSQVGYPGELNMNADRQDTAWRDMMIGSDVFYNPVPSSGPPRSSRTRDCPAVPSRERISAWAARRICPARSWV